MSGTFSIEEVKQIVQTLEGKEEEVGRMKLIICGIIFMACVGFGCMFGITIVRRPRPPAAARPADALRRVGR